MGEGLELPWVGGLCPELGLWPPFRHPNLSEPGRGGGDQSLHAQALGLISCSQGPNCRHFPREVSGHFQKRFQENAAAPSAAFPFPGLKALSALRAGVPDPLPALPLSHVGGC